jgi:hypothetical protein
MQSVQERAVGYMLDLPEAAGGRVPLVGRPQPSPPAGWSVEGMRRLLRHGALHFPELAALLPQNYPRCGAALLQQVRCEARARRGLDIQGLDMVGWPAASARFSRLNQTFSFLFPFLRLSFSMFNVLMFFLGSLDQGWALQN